MAVKNQIGASSRRQDAVTHPTETTTVGGTDDKLLWVAAVKLYLYPCNRMSA